MIARILFAAALSLLGTGWVAAETEEQPEFAHKASVQKRQQCRKQAVEQGLSGDPLRAFVARCMKK